MRLGDRSIRSWCCCSASSPSAAARLAAARSSSTRRPVTQFGGCARRRRRCAGPASRSGRPLGVPRRRRRVRRHSRPPRRAAWRPADPRSAQPGGSAPSGPDCSCAAWSTSRRRCPRPAHRSRCGSSVATSAAMCPHASQQLDQRVPEPGDRRPGGVPRRRGRQPQCARPTRRSARSRRRPSPASSVAAARLPDRAADLHRQRRQQRRPAVRRRPARRPASAANFAPTVLGRAACVSVRASIGVVRCVSASSASACDLGGELVGRARSRTSRRHNISAVSTTSWLVNPRCSQRAVGSRPERSRSSATRPLTGLPSTSARRGDRLESPSPSRGPRRSAACRRGAIPRLDQAGEPCLFDRDHGRAGTRRHSSASPARSSPGQNRSVMRRCPG